MYVISSTAAGTYHISVSVKIDMVQSVTAYCIILICACLKQRIETISISLVTTDFFCIAGCSHDWQTHNGIRQQQRIHNQYVKIFVYLSELITFHKNLYLLPHKK